MALPSGWLTRKDILAAVVPLLGRETTRAEATLLYTMIANRPHVAPATRTGMRGWKGVALRQLPAGSQVAMDEGTDVCSICGEKPYHFTSEGEARCVKH